MSVNGAPLDHLELIGATNASANIIIWYGSRKRLMLAIYLRPVFSRALCSVRHIPLPLTLSLVTDCEDTTCIFPACTVATDSTGSYVAGELDEAKP